MYMVAVNAAKCEGCEECVNNCPQEVFRMVDGKSDPYQTSECVFCETCLSVCPTSVITITEM
ncbi:MAG: 4Fe-4S dicluster domain-containing protein [Nitrospirota bacterium]|jgi:NAD-dependent dihydropyrimidine dehydrogenase PreA subunit